MNGCNKLEFVIGRPFQPNIMFSNKARAYPSEAPCGCSIVGLAFYLTHTH